MTTDFRALCAELVQIADALDGKSPSVANQGQSLDGFAALANFRQVAARARAALADGPAVPEGREPVSVISEPSDEEGPSIEDVEELCEEHCFNVEGYESIECLQGLINEAIDRWGNPAPQPPAEGEVAELVAWLRDQDGWMGTRVIYSRIAELLQRLSPPQPVQVSERLPGPEDCDAEGRCWWWYPEVPGKTYGYWAHEDDAVPERAFNEQPLHWLPAHALPVPGQEVVG